VKLKTMKRKIIPYKKKLKYTARMLRKNMTLSEILLWKELKGKQLLGYDFDRQRPIDSYIVDFYCKDLQLAIEIDGESHYYDGAYERDIKRQKRLESLGVRFLRFEDEAIKQNLGTVLTMIEEWILSQRPTPLVPLQGGD
jgi:very-short-patch-repair endonuclease